MISLIALLVAVALPLLAPHVLARGRWPIRRPALALVGWTGSLLLGILAIITAVAAWMLPTPMWQRPGCGGCGPMGAYLIGFAAAALLGALAAFVGGNAERIHTSRREHRSDVVVLGAASANHRVTADGILVSQVDGLGLSAVSSRTCGRQVFLGTMLVERLSTAEVDTVVEHERAHLIQRHDWVLLLARLNVTCFPRSSGACHFAARVHLLVELAADDRAARRCGTAPTASALRTLAGLTGDDAAAMRADRLSKRRGQTGAPAHAPA